ncbi:hypothetical protein ACN47E_004099 [Coniothyrium glycines]
MGTKRSRPDSASSSDDPSSPYSREQSVDLKLVQLDAESALSVQPAVMRCSLPPHQPLVFASFDEYDVHYQKAHTNRCSACQKNFPDEHFLNLHIAELHDPISASLRDKGDKTYACLVPDCDRLCSTPQKRRMHCIDKHLFPRNYDFFIVKDGIDRRSSMLRPPHRRRSSALNSTSSVGGSARQRGESVTSATSEGLEMVNDGYEGAEDEEEEGIENEARRYPTQLRGRGGFGHARGSDRGRGRRVSTEVSHEKATAPANVAIVDPVDSLTSRMSALQFVPHSVRAAKGKGRGRGG